jgi:hypothetical protein
MGRSKRIGPVRVLWQRNEATFYEIHFVVFGRLIELRAGGHKLPKGWRNWW